MQLEGKLLDALTARKSSPLISIMLMKQTRSSARLCGAMFCTFNSTSRPRATRFTTTTRHCWKPGKSRMMSKPEGAMKPQR